FIFISSRRLDRGCEGDWSSDVCSSDLTVIPAAAKAKISLRLPPELKSAEAYPLFEKAVKEVAPAGVRVTVHRRNSGEGVLVSPRSEERRVGKECEYASMPRSLRIGEKE